MMKLTKRTVLTSGGRIQERSPGPAQRLTGLYRNTAEAINAVMYSLLSEFRDGDNVVTTTLEHNSNYVPWYGMCREILQGGMEPRARAGLRWPPRCA